MSMSISITLTPAEERKLAELARAKGKDPAGYAHDVVSAYLNVADENGTRTLMEILAPIWEEWRRSGMSDSEIDNLFERELQETRSERRAAKGTL
jgi:hypothetical protein